jgi:hypothetical protein
VPIPGIVNVPADRFLRPWSAAFAWAERAKHSRIAREMRAAALSGGSYHLWWHPHNFGVNLAENLAGLRAVLDAFDELRRTHGMQSRTMSSVAAEVLSRSSASTP